MSSRSHQFVCEGLETRRLLSAAIKDLNPPRLPDPVEAPALNTRLPSLPPSGPIDPVAEYEPMEGLVISWMTYTSILGQITKRVTDVAGRVYIGVTSSTVQNSATATLNSLGVNMSFVTFSPSRSHRSGRATTARAISTRAACA
jgi:hypothetical protein